MEREKEIRRIQEILAGIWPEWEIKEWIGGGGFAEVYVAEHQDLAGTAYAAIKVISIPRNEGELEEYRAEGYTLEEIRSTFETDVKSVTREITSMNQLKGFTNIVSIEDYTIFADEEKPLWLIFIRMELLTPLRKKIAAAEMTEADVIQLGIDICTALDICESRRIVHRDVKPSNIFVNDHGDYKLGDFGVSRVLAERDDLTKAGTPKFMAPEVYKDQLQAKDLRAAVKVDIYSLGVTMYWACNSRRTPFEPVDKTILTPEEEYTAFRRRMNGEEIPAPAWISAELKRILLKACAFDPANRYASAREMKNDLQRLKLAEEQKHPSEPVERPEPEVTPAEPAGAAKQSGTKPISQTQISLEEELARKDRKEKRLRICAFVIAAVAAVMLALWLLIPPTPIPWPWIVPTAEPTTVPAPTEPLPETEKPLPETTITETATPTSTTPATDTPNPEPTDPETIDPETPAMETTAVETLTAEAPAVESTPVVLTEGGCRYQVMEDDTLMVIGWEKDVGVAEIPERVQGKPVTAIGAGAFEGEEGLTRLTLPESVTILGEGAFRGCTRLTRLTLPESLREIGAEAFAGCANLLSVSLPAGVTRLERRMFAECTKLGEVKLAEGLTAIGDGAFEGCVALTALAIPASVTEIGQQPFRGCKRLAEIRTAKGQEAFSVRDYVLMENATGRLICYMAGRKNRSLTVPEGVTAIEAYAVQDSVSLTEIIVPEGVTKIGEGAFTGCAQLAKVTIPGSVTEIGEEIFAGCGEILVTVNAESAGLAYCKANGIAYSITEP